jgi:putative FmdB family regulatory protein
MPIYAYRCEACGHELDALQKISDAPLTDCPACGAAALKKQITAAAFRLKGSGWYETDFKKDGKKNLHQTDDKPKEKADARRRRRQRTRPKPAKPAKRQAARPRPSKPAGNEARVEPKPKPTAEGASCRRRVAPGPRPTAMVARFSGRPVARPPEVQQRRALEQRSAPIGIDHHAQSLLRRADSGHIDQTVGSVRLGAPPARPRRRHLRRPARPRGLVQVVFDPDRPEMFALAEQVRSEYVLAVRAACAAAPRAPRTRTCPPARWRCWRWS